MNERIFYRIGLSLVDFEWMYAEGGRKKKEQRMELSELIHPGMSREDTFPVTMDNSAIHIGSGSSRVLATPWMIAFMERVSHRLLTCCLPEGYSSVGTHLDVHHLAPTPVGATIRVKAEVLSLDGNRVYF